MVSIGSAAEDAFIESLKPSVSLSTWIGLKKDIFTGIYSWDNGALFNYENFAPEANSDNNRNCVYSQNSKWYTIDCINYRRRYFCQRRGSMYNFFE